MTDAMVIADNAPSGTGDQDRSKVLRRLKLRDTGFRMLTQISAATVLLILCGVILSLVIGSLPAIREFGLGFLFTQRWNPVTEKFGALAPISGTLITSAIAMLIAVPVGLGISIFLTELCPQPLRRPIAIAI
jgi:phosphate transport system permease protein